jgi:hypothetical protein
MWCAGFQKQIGLNVLSELMLNLPPTAIVNALEYSTARKTSKIITDICLFANIITVIIESVGGYAGDMWMFVFVLLLGIKQTGTPAGDSQKNSSHIITFSH